MSMRHGDRYDSSARLFPCSGPDDEVLFRVKAANGPESSEAPQRWEIVQRLPRRPDVLVAEAVAESPHDETATLLRVRTSDRELLVSLEGPATREGARRRHVTVRSWDGAPLAEIGYRRGGLLPWPRRHRWTVEPSAGGKIVGREGTWYAWMLSILLFPVWAPLWFVLFVYSLLEGSPWDGVSSPSRIRWYGGRGDWLMDRRAGLGFRFTPVRLDTRIAVAQALLAATRTGSRQGAPARG